MYHSTGDSSNHFWPEFPRRSSGEAVENPCSSAGSGGNCRSVGRCSDSEIDEQPESRNNFEVGCGDCGSTEHIYDHETGDTVCTDCGLTRRDLVAQWLDPINQWDVFYAPGRMRHQKSVHCVHKYFKKKLVDLNLKLTSEQLYQLINSFKAVRSIWSRVATVHKRTYSINYTFAARKLCEVNCLWRLADAIPLPKVRSTTQKLDAIWLSVTEELGWDYYPSLADGHPPVLRCRSP